MGGPSAAEVLILVSCRQCNTGLEGETEAVLLKKPPFGLNGNIGKTVSLFHSFIIFSAQKLIGNADRDI